MRRNHMNTWTHTADRLCAERYLALSVDLLRALCTNDTEAGREALAHAEAIEAWFAAQGITTAWA